MTPRARTRISVLFALALVACTTASNRSSVLGLRSSENAAYLFSYFRGNGDDGVHLAWSADGITWSALNGGKSVITPAITGDGIGWQDWNSKGALMRDPECAELARAAGLGPSSCVLLVSTEGATDPASYAAATGAA